MANQKETLYTVHVTFHAAQNLPVADLTNFSCDPYIEATIVVPAFGKQSEREPEDPPLKWRTPTVYHSRDPEWNCHWIFSGVPESGFVLEMRVKDEDHKRDDSLGKAEVTFERSMMHEGFEVKEKAYKVQKRKGSPRPWLQTYLAAIFPGQKLKKHNRVVISAKIIGKSHIQEGRKPYIVGPNVFTQHFSPVLGNIVNRGDKFTKSLPTQKTGDSKRTVSASSFVAVKLQLEGPAPPEFRCHYVGYNTFIKWLYSNSGVLGHLLNHGLKRQYRTIYSYNKSTKYGVIESTNGLEDGEGGEPAGSSKADDQNPNTELAQKFLELTRYGAGGRLFTYVLTLDAEWRFSETGDEFAIDFLSKHMMHANGAPMVMISGEFFVRKIAEFEDSKRSRSKRKDEHAKGNSTEAAKDKVDDGPHDDAKVKEERDEAADDGDVDRDPSHYELIIDNNSGTYRPSVDLLPPFQSWLAAPCRLGGLGRVTAMDAFDDGLKKMKEERKEEKKRLAGGKVAKKVGVKRRGSSVSSVSSVGSASSMSSSEVESVLAEAEKRNEEQEEQKEQKDGDKGPDPSKGEVNGEGQKGDENVLTNGHADHQPGKDGKVEGIRTPNGHAQSSAT